MKHIESDLPNLYLKCTYYFIVGNRVVAIIEAGNVDRARRLAERFRRNRCYFSAFLTVRISGGILGC